MRLAICSCHHGIHARRTRWSLYKAGYATRTYKTRASTPEASAPERVTRRNPTLDLSNRPYDRRGGKPRPGQITPSLPSAAACDSSAAAEPRTVDVNTRRPDLPAWLQRPSSESMPPRTFLGDMLADIYARYRRQPLPQTSDPQAWSPQHKELPRRERSNTKLSKTTQTLHTTRSRSHVDSDVASTVPEEAAGMEDAISQLLSNDPSNQQEAARSQKFAAILDYILENRYAHSHDRILRSVIDLGYTTVDLYSWLTLLRSRNDSQRAIMLQLAVDRTQQQTRHGHRIPPSSHLPIPLLIISALLQKSDLGIRTIGRVVMYLFTIHDRASQLRHDPASRQVHRSDQAFSQRSRLVLQMVSHLARHGRERWPPVLPHVAALYVQWSSELAPVMCVDDRLSANKKLRSLTQTTNALLATLAIPSASRSMQNAEILARAQATVVEFMVHHKPPLELDRVGFQAIASVRLMLPKSEKDRQWALLKALSWPPWKDDKTGKDSHVEAKDGMSVAADTLNRAQEAGFTSEAWDKVARVYTGWDTDLSPTIQTRQIVGKIHDWQESVMLWAARVRVGRTLKECWAAFESYQWSVERLQAPVCQAMLEKLLAEGRRVRQLSSAPGSEPSDLPPFSPYEEILPGDSKAVFAPPPSAHQEIHTRTSPPTLKSFVGTMLTHGIVLDDNGVRHLLQHATNLDDGLHVLRVAKNKAYHGSNLNRLRRQLEHTAGTDKLAHALLRHLNRFMPTSSRPAMKAGATAGGWTLSGSYAGMLYVRMRDELKLLRAAEGTVPNRLEYNAGSIVAPTTRTRTRTDVDILQEYTSVLRALLDDRNLAPFVHDNINVPGNLGVHRGLVAQIAFNHLTLPYRAHVDRMLALHIAVEVDESIREAGVMIEEPQVSLSLAIGYRANVAAREALARISADIKEDRNSPDHDREADELLRISWEAQKTIRDVQSRLRARVMEALRSGPGSVGSGAIRPRQLPSGPHGMASPCSPPSIILPRLHMYASSRTLHHAVRTFGAANDAPGLLEVVGFARDFWPEVRERMGQERRGVANLRLALVAMRLFLTLGHDAAGLDSSPSDVLQVYSQARHEGRMAAPADVVAEIEDVVESMGSDWGGWADDDEVEAYIMKSPLPKR